MSIVNRDMTKKDIRKKIYAMIIPVIGENILQMTVGLVSMAMISRISNTAVAAQGICSLIIGIAWSLFKGLSLGGTVLVAKAYGAGDTDKLERVVQQTMISSFILVLILQQVIYWHAGAILSIFNPKPNVMAHAIGYIRTVSFGLPFLSIVLNVNGALQGMGNTKTPLMITTILNLVNIALGYILIFGILGFNGMGLKGAAVALISAQFISSLCALYIVFGKDGILRNMRNTSFFKLQIKQVGEIFNIGIPSGFETIFWQLASIILGRVILSFGEVSYAANQLGLQAESISEMPALGFGLAATALTGQALGAMNKKLGKEYIKEISKGAILVISIGIIILLFFPHVAMRLLTDDEEVIRLGAIYLRLMGLVQIPQNLQRVFTGAIKGAGFTKIPMLIAGIGLWGIRVPAALILTKYFHLSIISIWIVVCIDQTLRFILSYIIYKKKNIFKEAASDL